ncbi:MAG: hypothetical protein A3H44_10755 [Gammaproteobacteria bacterium RIFCSPLOWO2_02_FULL_57_10]|nr:MAG: hypothetical protein A3H44_10755 [Gammaproteobacteria bacterium RIFCSPLOWO2_02_FULL_57_10]
MPAAVTNLAVLTPVHITGNDHHRFSLMLSEQLEQAGALMRVVGPGFPAGELREQLNAGADDAHIRFHLQLLLQPLPLRFSHQHRIRCQVDVVRPHLLCDAGSTLCRITQLHQR